MVTRKDVAKMAEVSVTAVSRVMNNSGYVSKEKRKAILKAVEKLGYRPSTVALAMQRRSTKQLLFCSKDITNIFYIELYRGMIGYAAQRGYMVLLSGTWDIERIKTMLVDGVILPNETAAIEYVKQIKNTMQLPEVCASYGASTEKPQRMPFIESDTHVAMEMLIDYLFDNQHQKIALATPFPVTHENPRGKAYRNKLYPILGQRLDDYIFISENFAHDAFGTDEEDFFSCGEELAEKMVARKTDATAVVCFNDSLAIGLIHQFHRLGVQVPNDISVAGIDGIFTGKLLYPKLTSVSISPYEQGKECVRVLLDMLAGKKVKGRTTMPMQIVEGESVKRL